MNQTYLGQRRFVVDHLSDGWAVCDVQTGKVWQPGFLHSEAARLTAHNLNTYGCVYGKLGGGKHLANAWEGCPICNTVTELVGEHA